MTVESQREDLSQFLKPDNSDGIVFPHGTTEGVYERAAVWLLGNSDQGDPESPAGLAIQSAFRDMEGEAPFLQFNAGDVRATLGMVDYPTAYALAVKGLEALVQSEVPSGGVGVSVKIVTFPK